MKFAHIVNLSNFYLADEYNDMHLLLYHWGLQSNVYNDFCRQSKIYKIADNSQYELRKEIDSEDYLKWAIDIGADEIIAPDVMHDMKKTIKLIEDFIPLVPNDMKIQGVVQGANVTELQDCFLYLNTLKGIDVIGISKCGCIISSRVNQFEVRQSFLSSIISVARKPIHFLGVNSILDFSTKGIRSIDGKFLCKMANHGNKIDLFTQNVSRKRLAALFELIILIRDEQNER